MTLVSSLHSTILFTLLLVAQQVHAKAEFSNDPPDSCVIKGDDEIYGTGIRISFYIQWAAAVLATWACPDQIKVARTGTNIVALAVMINTLKGGSEGGLLVPELFIVTNLVFTLNLFNIPPKIGLLRQSAGSLGAMFVVWCLALFAAPWVWFKNVEQGAKEGCVVKLWFFFAPINIYNKGWMTFFKVASVFEVLGGVASFVGALVAIGLSIFNNLSEGGGSWGSVDDDDLAVKFAMKGIVCAFQLITGGVAIGMVERTIKTNGILLDDSIESSGQLVPLIIGAATFGSTVCSGIKNLVLYLKGSSLKSQ